MVRGSGKLVGKAVDTGERSQDLSVAKHVLVAERRQQVSWQLG